jgi:hypothetical protein
MKLWHGMGVLLFGVAWAAQAQDQTPNVADLAALRSESALLKERLNNLRLRLDMENLRGSTALGSTDENEAFSGLRVAQVSGLEGHYRATLIWPNGDSFTGAAGTKINPHLWIQTVAADRVTLKGDRGVFTVPFQGLSEPITPASNVAAGPIGLPAIPARGH